MPTAQGLVDPSGAIVRLRGQFTVIAKTGTVLEVRVPGIDTRKAFVLATPWRADGDIGPAAVSASPKPGTTNRMLFAVDAYYGLSFRIETP